jgi:adenylate kinase family enzyme
MRDLGTFAKDGFSLIPKDFTARSILGRLKEAERVFIEVWLPRNMAQHRKYFGVLNRVVQADGRWSSVEDLSFDIMLELRRGTFRTSRDGSTHFRPDSRAVASMPKAEFERLYDDTMRLLASPAWLGCDPEMLLEDAA